MMLSTTDHFRWLKWNVILNFFFPFFSVRHKSSHHLSAQQNMYKYARTIRELFLFVFHFLMQQSSSQPRWLDFFTTIIECAITMSVSKRKKGKKLNKTWTGLWIFYLRFHLWRHCRKWQWKSKTYRQRTNKNKQKYLKRMKRKMQSNGKYIEVTLFLFYHKKILSFRLSLYF